MYLFIFKIRHFVYGIFVEIFDVFSSIPNKNAHRFASFITGVYISKCDN